MSTEPPPKDPAFEAKRQEWIRCLDHKDPGTGRLDRNCVLSQVSEMVWNAGAYRVVLEARRIADRDERGRIKLHGLTHQLLDRCFYQTQLLTIRRLMDKSPLDGNRGVFSLKSLVLDMKKHHRLFTRQNLFAAFGEATDVEALRNAVFEYISKREEQGHHLSDLPIRLSPDLSMRLHQSIDLLCGVQSNNRQLSDVVPASVFERIEAKLDATREMCQHVDKFLAHAATPESRAIVDADAANLTYQQLWHAHETICRACQFIDCYLLRQTSHSFLPIASGDLFKYADHPLTTSTAIDDLRRHWNAYKETTESWEADCLKWATHD